MPRAFRLQNARPKRVKCPDCAGWTLRLAQYNTRGLHRPLLKTQWRWIDRGICAGPKVVEAYTSGGTRVRGELVQGPRAGYDIVAAYPVHECGGGD